MKTNRISLVVVSILAAIVTALFPTTAQAEPPQPASGPSEWIVPIFLPDIDAIPELNTTKWINLADLPTAGQPESTYQGFRLPHINAVYTWHKSVIKSLTSKCSIILIDYKEASADDLLALPINHIVAIGVCGPQARVVTTSVLTSDSNTALVSADLMEFVAMAKAAGYSKQ